MRKTVFYCLKGKGNLQSLELTHLPHLRSMLQQPLNDLKQQRGEVQIFLPVIGQKISRIRILLHVRHKFGPTVYDEKYSFIPYPFDCVAVAPLLQSNVVSRQSSHFLLH